MKYHDPNCKGCRRCKHFHQPFPHATFCQITPCKCGANDRMKAFEKEVAGFFAQPTTGTELQILSSTAVDLVEAGKGHTFQSAAKSGIAAAFCDICGLGNGSHS